MYSVECNLTCFLCCAGEYRIYLGWRPNKRGPRPKSLNFPFFSTPIWTSELGRQDHRAAFELEVKAFQASEIVTWRGYNSATNRYKNLIQKLVFGEERL